MGGVAILKLYIVSIEHQGFDTYDSHLVATYDEKQARIIASRGHADEGEKIRLEKSKVKYIGQAVDLLGEGTHLSSFNAG